MKKKIVIASVLKPVDDVRAYWKLSQSIAKTNKYEVNIIGNEGKKRSDVSNILFHSHTLNRNNWIKRIWIRVSVLLKILKIKPNLVVITSHELINTALVCKLLLRCKLVYDIQENYKRNVSIINTSLPRKLMAILIRFKETISQFFIDSYWLAESCYQSELNFVKDKFVIIENKAFEYPMGKREFNQLKLLFSGTISEYGGVKRAVQVYQELRQSIADTTLTIIGQVHDSKLHSWLIEQQKMHPGLTLEISKAPIPYDTILLGIAQANLGVIGYQPNAVNENKVPTKLYEYSRYQLPYLVEKDTKWSKLGQGLGGAIVTDFSNIDIDDLLKKWKKPSEIFPKQYPNQATWENESDRLVTSLNSLIL